jgi:O-antigen/teichoic acid export membrane protein
MTMILLIVAEPFFTIWAGPDFGKASIIPYYILMIGVFFSLIMYIPNSILLAYGKTGLFARIYWIEILPYFILAVFLISKIGIAGAALVWSLREVLNAAMFFYFSKKHTGISYKFGFKLFPILICVGLLSIPVLVARLYSNFSPWLLVVALLSAAAYFHVAWTAFLRPDERFLTRIKVKSIFSRLRFF